MTVTKSLNTLLAIVMVTFVASSTCAAQSPSLTLMSKLGGKGSGRAVYRDAKWDRSFSVKVRSIPNAMLVVSVHRGKDSQKIAWMKTDKDGWGQVNLSLRSGSNFPQLQNKDLIRVWVGNPDKTVLTGRLGFNNSGISGR